MNGNDLREALHTTMSTIAEPPPMDSATAVTSGRRAARRRATLAGAGAATAVIAMAALIAGPGQQWFDREAGPAWDPAAQPSAAGTASDRAAGGAPQAAPTATPDAGSKSRPSWPTEVPGKPQEDATARSGPRYEQGKRLFQQLLAVAPEGYATPTGDTPEGVALQEHQAAVEAKSWAYLASVAVARDGGTGRLMAEVHTAGNGLPTEPCALARAFWGLGGTCETVTTGGTTVGVVVGPGEDDRLDQWAAYRHADGIVVYVAQSRRAANAPTAMAPLPELPLSVQELAALATDRRFHLE